jgi:hypothetical protein
LVVKKIAFIHFDGKKSFSGVIECVLNILLSAIAIDILLCENNLMKYSVLAKTTVDITKHR